MNILNNEVVLHELEKNLILVTILQDFNVYDKFEIIVNKKQKKELYTLKNLTEFNFFLAENKIKEFRGY